MTRAALVPLLLALGACSATTHQQREEDAIQAGLESGRAACLLLQQDKTIQRAPDVDTYCAAVLNGCPK